MNRLENILKQHISDLHNSDINFITRKIEHLNENIPWYYYIKIIGIIASVLILLRGLFKNKYSDENRIEPFSKRLSYVLLLIGGLFGTHQFYLRQKIQAYIYWFLIAFFFILNAHFFYVYLKFPAVIFDLSSYTILSKIIFLSMIGLIIKDIFLIPFFCYKQNNNIYKRHFETNLILGDKKNSVTKHLSLKQRILSKINSADGTIHEILNDKSINSEGPEVSNFFKYIVTLGKSSKLQKEVNRLSALQQVALDAQISFREAMDYHNHAEVLLIKCRMDVYRNLSLAKEMISIIKDNLRSKDNELVKDNIIKVKIESIDYLHDEKMITTAFDDGILLDDIRKNVKKSIMTTLDNKREINKNTLIEDSIELTFNLIGNLISEIGRLNKEVVSKRLEVQRAKNEIESAMLNTSKAFLAIKSNILRINEITEALDRVNRSFIKRYEPLRQKVFGESNFINYLNHRSKRKELKNDMEFWEEIKLLCQICHEYNKINKAKIIEDGK
ncbi:hypothetical protein [Sphingobacterium sp.]|uniref:hypothetical protein n=1 Tax=Sphingobacterium sp. TaxID=341027 RepID=UPI0028A19F8B|nr:hypothetical protein [Sphingobacterium sp.]